MTFPWIRTMVEAQRLSLHAAYFDVSSGLLSVFDRETKSFASIAGAGHSRLFTQPRF